MSPYSRWAEGAGADLARPWTWTPLQQSSYMDWKRRRFREHWHWMQSLDMPAIIRAQSGRQCLIDMVRGDLAEALAPPPVRSPYGKAYVYPGTPKTAPKLFDGVTSEQVSAWVAADPARLAMRPTIQRALAFIDQFRPKFVPAA